MEMGLGKTRSFIDAAERIAKAKKKKMSALVIAPASVLLVWEDEIGDWSKGPVDFRCLSYEGAVKKQESLKGKRFDFLIIDEAHKCKEPTTGWTNTILGNEGIARTVGRIWAGTGTPMPNHPAEMWTFLSVAGKTQKSYEAFAKYYCFCKPPVARGRKLRIYNVYKDKKPELRELLDSFWFRRLKKDCLKNMPAILWSNVSVEGGKVNVIKDFSEFTGPNQEEAVKNALIREKKILDEAPSYIEVQDSVSTLRKFTGLQKVKGVVNLIGEELTNGAYQKIVIFAWHREVVKGIRDGLRDRGHRGVIFYGAMGHGAKRRAISAFNLDDRCKVFVANIKAAGLGLDLTVAHQVFFAEFDWTPGNNAQAAMRCHRVNQKADTVFVRISGLKGSFDEVIASTVRRKEKGLVGLL